jgi:2-polyprenyl-3-methyl-5-hydroxy-6-metoxy-1,4-benzoquinol methylase
VLPLRRLSSRTRTREPQYERCLAVERSAGRTVLGLMANQVWHDDPRRLAFVLARYKFVAKMLAGQRSVAEVGCADAFGTRIVAQEVGRVTAYDFDPLLVADARSQGSRAWPIEVRVHDMLSSPLPERYGAVYCLDVFEHIAPRKARRFLDHVRRSLTASGVFVLGAPSLESQAHASPISRAGHVNCRSGPALKRTLAAHFQNVFMFSMNDEVVHTGFQPMAHYLLALCVGPRSG